MFYKIINTTLRLGFILSFLSGQAQMYKDFSNIEYIVTYDGDTSVGEVRMFNSYNLEFKNLSTNEITRIDPYKIKIAYESERYFFRSIDFTYNDRTEKVFLTELISGDAALFEFTDSSYTESYYIKKRGDKFRKLSTSNFNMMRRALLLDCDSLPLTNTNFTGDTRFNIIADQIAMHNAKCSSIENPFRAHYEKKRNPIFFELKVGVMLTKFTERYYDAHISGNVSELKPGFNLGIGAHIPLIPYFYWNPDLLYTNLGKNYEPYSNKFYETSEQLSFSSNALDFLPAQFILRSNEYKINPNFSFGIGFRYIFKNIPESTNNIGAGFSPILSLGIGFDYEIKKQKFIRVMFQYKYYRDYYYYPRDSDFDLSTYSYGLMLSYLLH